jgi:hypothetical protein
VGFSTDTQVTGLDSVAPDDRPPANTLTALLIVFGVAVLVVLPSIGPLFTLAQRSLIEEGERPQPQQIGR